MPGLLTEVISSSTSAISAIIEKILVSVAALPKPMKAVRTRTGTMEAPSLEKAKRPKVAKSLMGAPIRIVVLLEVAAITGPKITIPTSCEIRITAIR